MIAIARGWLGSLLVAASPLLGATPALAGPPSAPVGIWSLQWENSSLAGGGRTDRNYTNGLRLSWTSPSGRVPQPLAWLGRALWGDGTPRVSLGILQQMFTPADTQAKPPSPLDRPYAGYLAASLALIQANANARNTLGLALGVIGPPAGGEEVQNGFHHLIGQGTNKGWGYQLRAEPTVELTAGRTWRIPLARTWIRRIGGIETDALPTISAGIGNVRIYAETGVIFRLGQGLGADFGPSRLPPAPNGGSAFRQIRKLVWYVLLGVGGQAVGHDLFLDGNTFRSGPHVTRDPVIGEAEAGITVIYHGVRISYTQVVQTRSYHGQQGGPFNFGVFTLSTRF
ncbi:MAG: lipid A deacylase LpxR family protein [Rhodospirillales bacterium]|nr:lipid A deacylase LpxR family protein [Rhodospirillales bacterium]